MVDNIKFHRVSDTAYGLEPNGQFTPEISVDFEKCAKVIQKPEERFDLVHELFQNIDNEEKKRINAGIKPVYFKHGDRQFVLHPKTNLVLRIIAYLFRFLKIINNETKIEYRISEARLPAFISKPRLQLSLSQRTPIEIDYDPSDRNETSLYSDPFTQIATELFQVFEEYHVSKDVDHPFLDGSKYQIVLQDDQLVAKMIDDEDVTDEDRVDTVRAYRDFVRRRFGDHIIDRIQIQYGIDLNELVVNYAPLTAEMVYRINVGTSHIEVADIEKLAKDLKEQRNDFSERESLGIQRFKEANDLTDEDFDAWVQRLNLNVEEDFASLMSIFELTEEEKETIFTGRVIKGKISGWYTQSDLVKYKPWVDQQEFTQTCFKLAKRNWNDTRRNWDCFYEDMALILCKKHLYQKNKDGTYRVGAIIPAPREEGKPQLYYKVSSLIHNSRGIFSYTLEPTCEGSALPAIKLYRSTSSDTYNLDGMATAKNDFNPINSPGYEGSHILFDKAAETEFITSRTIPVWVGYHYLANKSLESEEVYENLKKSSEELIYEIEAKYEKPSLKKFIRTHDSEFLELIHDCRHEKIISPWEAWSLLNNSLRSAVRNNLDSNAQEVKPLQQFLTKVSQIDEYSERAAELLKWWGQDEDQISEKEQTIIDRLNEFIDRGDGESQLAEWSEFIQDYAICCGEDIDSKIKQNVNFVGHSLGGACAQRFMLHYTSSTGRVPLPGHTVGARIFDDPAINEEDNDAFIAYGNKHAPLLMGMNAKFSIVRRQEAGDFVAQSGEVHLGATPRYYDDEVYKWLHFDSALQAATSHAKVPEIRDYVSAHGRMFGDESSRYFHAKKMRSKLKKKKPKLLRRQAVLQAKAKLTMRQRAELEQINIELDALKEAKALSRPGYVLTYYDSPTQYNFDKPRNGKIWRELRDLWKLPLRLNPMTAERLRTYVAAFFRSGFYDNALAQHNPEDDALHGNHKANIGHDGLLIVRLP